MTNLSAAIIYYPRMIDYSPNKTLNRIFCLWFGFSALAPAAEIEIFQLINERLSHMEDVALHKAQNNLPVEDLAREQTVIDNAVEAAAAQGLRGASIESFFTAQIEVAKAIQYRSLANWISEPANRTAPDLVTEIRPALTRLGDDIVQALANFLQSGNLIEEEQRNAFHNALTVPNINTADRDMLFNSLLLMRSQ